MCQLSELWAEIQIRLCLRLSRENCDLGCSDAGIISLRALVRLIT